MQAFQGAVPPGRHPPIAEPLFDRFLRANFPGESGLGSSRSSAPFAAQEYSSPANEARLKIVSLRGSSVQIRAPALGDEKEMGFARATTSTPGVQQQRPILGARTASPEQHSGPQQFSVIRHLLSWETTLISAAALAGPVHGGGAREPRSNARDAASKGRRAAWEARARPRGGGRVRLGARMSEGKVLDHLSFLPQGTYASAPGARR